MLAIATASRAHDLVGRVNQVPALGAPRRFFAMKVDMLPFPIPDTAFGNSYD